MKKNKDIKVIFIGSADFSVPILEMLIETFEVAAIVTEVDKRGGRNNVIIAPPGKMIAEKFAIPCLQPETLRNNKEIIDQLASYKADVFVVAAYGKILPQSVLSLPKHGCLNIHPSLLPKYRGASPIQSCLLNGETLTGTTIILMDAGMDTGDMVAQAEQIIQPKDNYASLSKRLAERSADLLKEKLAPYVSGELSLVRQIEVDATFCSKIEKEDGLIDWKGNVKTIYNKIRAYTNWPGTFTEFSGKKLDIITAKIKDNQQNEDYPVGQVYLEDQSVCVKCADGAIELIEIKLEGKNKTLIRDFINGHQDFVGSNLS